jgi:hypothetical protein
MNMRAALCAVPSFAISLFAIPVIALAQSNPPAPPPAVDQALRARVNEFLQYFVDGNFRKAFDLVGEDTKDDFFSMGKSRLKAFEVQKVSYSPDFASADVIVAISRDWYINGRPMPITAPITTQWKLEKGAWVYHHDPSSELVTPMGGTQAEVTKANGGAHSTGPPDLSEAGIQAAARAILGRAMLEKSEITLPTDRPSEAKVSFHNGTPGSLQVVLRSQTGIPGLSGEVQPSVIGPGDDATIVVRFAPTEGRLIPPQATMQLAVSPTAQVFNLAIRLTSSAAK